MTVKVSGEQDEANTRQNWSCKQKLWAGGLNSNAREVLERKHKYVTQRELCLLEA